MPRACLPSISPMGEQIEKGLLGDENPGLQKRLMCTGPAHDHTSVPEASFLPSSCRLPSPQGQVHLCDRMKVC